MPANAQVPERAVPAPLVFLRRHGPVLAATVVVCAVTAVVHQPALTAQSTNFDDGQYFLENRLVQNPGWGSVATFFGEVLEPSTVGGYYQPLAMTSLMIDWALGGRPENLRRFHVTSLTLHVVNVALVIWLLYLLFGNASAAAIVGLLFGVHPLSVEPIPWVSERKTLLAALFVLGALLAYVSYVRRGHWTAYGVAVVLFVLALLSKPTSTPLPVLLILLDVWPLRRVSWRALADKGPFFVLAGVSAVITFVSQAETAAVALPQERPWYTIPLTLTHNIVFYPLKMVWPSALTAHYAFPEPLLAAPLVWVGLVGTAVLLAGLAVSLRWTRAPAVGWLFFFVAIFPTMGVIGFTNVIASDKYAYLPVVGLLMVLCRLLKEWWERPVLWRRVTAQRTAVIIAAIGLAGAAAWRTRAYYAVWQDTETLYRHMLSYAPNAHSVHDYLGVQLFQRGEVDEAIRHFKAAVDAFPRNFSAHNNLGTARAAQGDVAGAIRHFQRAIEVAPEFPNAYSNLGRALDMLNQPEQAIELYRLALARDPYHVDAHKGLAVVYARRGEFAEAETHFRDAIAANAYYLDAYIGLARVLIGQGRIDEAQHVYEQALARQPQSPQLRMELQRFQALRARLATQPAR